MQEQRLKQLQELAVRRPWDEARRQIFKSRYDQLRAEGGDASRIDAMGVTREILAAEQAIKRPPGVFKVDVIAAYNSAASLREDFLLQDVHAHLATQALLLKRKLAVPNLAGAAEEVFVEAVKLSRNEKFRAKRRELFDWQETAVQRGYTPEQAVSHIAEMSEEYNNSIKDAFGDVRWKFAFTISSVALGLAGAIASGPVAPLAGAIALGSAVLSLVQFAKLDGKPALDTGAPRAVALFHDMETQLGVKLSQQDQRADELD